MTYWTEARFRRAGYCWLGLVLLAALSLALLWQSGRLRIQTDIFALLPAGDYRPEVSLANQRVGDAVNRKLFLLLASTNTEATSAASRALLKAAQDSQLFLPVRHTDPVASLGPTLFQHRAALLSHQDQALLQAEDYAGLQEQALLQLASPGLPITQAMLSQDPFLFFPRFLLERAAHGGQMDLREGWPALEKDGQSYRLIILDLAQSPFGIAYQDELKAWLQTTRTQLAQENDLKLYATGTALFAAAGSQEARQEISTIGLGSTLGLIALILFSFRSPRPLLTELAAVGSGCLLAFLGTQLLFGEVHMITLVFGASLIGVSIDYSMNYLCAQAEQPQRSSLEVLRRLLPALALGLLTTLGAYVCLALTPFPGLRQIAVFSVLGLLGAWVTGMLLLPRLKPLNTQNVQRLLQPLQTLRLRATQQRHGPRLAALLFITSSGLVLWLWAPQDNIKSMQAINPALLQDEAAIREHFGSRQSNQYFIVYGDAAEQVAQREEALSARLRERQAQGALENYQALSDWLPSAQTQAARQAALRALPDHVLQSYSEISGLELAQLQAWRSAQSQNARLSLDALAALPLAQLALSPGAHLVMLHGLRDYQALENIRELPGVQFVDPVRDLSLLFSQYRVQAQWLVLAAIALLSLLLSLRYGWRALPATLGPVLVALSLTFALLCLLGVLINLFTVLAVFLILGIGVDYAIFYREAQSQSSKITVAIFLCMLSTALSFGLLALSNTPAISAFGLTVLIGVISSFLLATCLTKSLTDHDSKENYDAS